MTNRLQYDQKPLLKNQEILILIKELFLRDGFIKKLTWPDQQQYPTKNLQQFNIWLEK